LEYNAARAYLNVSKLYFGTFLRNQLMFASSMTKKALGKTLTGMVAALTFQMDLIDIYPFFFN